MKIFQYIVVMCAVGLGMTACKSEPDIEMSIHPCAALPSGGRACATTFVHEGEAYVFGGRDSLGNALNDLWKYTPETDTWTALGPTPLTPRVNATACTKEGKVYIGLGFKGRYAVDSCYMRDWWEYTPATGEWKRKADYPNSYTDRATAFTGKEELYVGFGFCKNYRRDMYRYTISEDRWDSIDVGVAFFGFPARSFGGTGCTCQGRHFMGTGYRKESLDWWGELLPEGKWVERSSVPGRTRTLAASAATDTYLYLCGGIHYGGVNTTGEVLQDMRRYDPQQDTWQWVAVMPKRLMNHVCFAIKGKVYFGLGEDEDYIANRQLYYIAE